jgi:hypothetical protein
MVMVQQTQIHQSVAGVQVGVGHEFRDDDDRVLDRRDRVGGRLHGEPRIEVVRCFSGGCEER